jgi:hypothetical protein
MRPEVQGAESCGEPNSREPRDRLKWTRHLLVNGLAGDYLRARGLALRRRDGRGPQRRQQCPAGLAVGVQKGISGGELLAGCEGRLGEVRQVERRCVMGVVLG